MLVLLPSTPVFAEYLTCLLFFMPESNEYYDLLKIGMMKLSCI